VAKPFHLHGAAPADLPVLQPTKVERWSPI
jgi:hypothetical protein